MIPDVETLSTLCSSSFSFCLPQLRTTSIISQCARDRIEESGLPNLERVYCEKSESEPAAKGKEGRKSRPRGDRSNGWPDGELFNLAARTEEEREREWERMKEGCGFAGGPKS
jgi:hypothetical protein